MEATYQAFNDTGVSSQFILGNDGRIFCSVNPDENIAFHAGESSFANFKMLNYYSIGIEHVNPGYEDAYLKYETFETPRQIPGDARWWYPFGNDQFVSSMSLTKTLQTKYRIPGWYVVTHADIAIDRKSDIGPMWPYERAFAEFGVGYWYTESHDVELDRFRALEKGDYVSLIKSFGYVSEDTPNLIKAYQMHYSPGNISGVLIDETKRSILRHVIGLHGYIDPTIGEEYGFFHEKFREWSSGNSEKARAFNEYLSVDK